MVESNPGDKDSKSTDELRAAALRDSMSMIDASISSIVDVSEDLARSTRATLNDLDEQMACLDSASLRAFLVQRDEIEDSMRSTRRMLASAEDSLTSMKADYTRQLAEIEPDPKPL